MVTVLHSLTLPTVVIHSLSSVLPGTILAISGYVNTGWISVTNLGSNFVVSKYFVIENDDFCFS
jgi:hypothetical protein